MNTNQIYYNKDCNSYSYIPNLKFKIYLQSFLYLIKGSIVVVAATLRIQIFTCETDHFPGTSSRKYFIFIILY